MPAQYWQALLNAPAPGVGASYNTSAALTDVSLAPQIVLPANFLQIGSAIRCTGWGTFSNTATPTLLLGVYYGGVAGVALAATTAITTITAATVWPWRVQTETTVRTVGASGTAITHGTALYPATISTFQAAYAMPGTAAGTAVTIDTTTAKAITLGAQWSASSASNALFVQQFLVESVA